MRPITAGDLMNPEVLTVPDDMTIQEASAFLLDNEISGAPVEDQEGHLVGVVSLVDIVAALSRPPGAEDGDGVLVEDIMTSGIQAVTEDATVPEVAQAMLQGHIHRLLVTREGQAVGIVSTSDLLGLLIHED